tara:strand:+ start:2615 stop:3535 length:921 start_codon:yes stop_codon:yes gene_type:complete
MPSTPPTAKDFNFFGRGNTQEFCITRLDMADYNFTMWTTLAGVNSDNPVTTRAKIKESFDIMVDVHYNTYAFEVDASSTGNNHGFNGVYTWDESIDEVVLKTTTYNSNGGLEYHRGDDATFPSLPHYRTCRRMGIKDDSGNFIAGGASNGFLTEKQQIRVSASNGSPLAIYNNGDLMGYSFFNTNIMPMGFFATGRVAAAKSEVHIRFLQTATSTAQRNSSLAIPNQYNNDFSEIDGMHCICGLRSANFTNTNTPSDRRFKNRSWDPDKFEATCDFEEDPDDDGEGYRNETSSVKVKSLVKYSYPS